jgi:hypothetical protein
MTNVNTEITRIYQATATDGAGTKIGYIKAVAKAAQNDTITITNANSVVAVIGLSTDAAGAAETRTFATNVITCTSATTGTISGLIIYN